MADLLRVHIEACPEHPKSKLKAELERERHRFHAAATLAEAGGLLEEADSAIIAIRDRCDGENKTLAEDARTTIHHGVWKALAEFRESLKAGVAPAMARLRPRSDRKQHLRRPRWAPATEPHRELKQLDHQAS